MTGHTGEKSYCHKKATATIVRRRYFLFCHNHVGMLYMVKITGHVLLVEPAWVLASRRGYPMPSPLCRCALGWSGDRAIVKERKGKGLFI